MADRVALAQFRAQAVSLAGGLLNSKHPSGSSEKNCTLGGRSLRAALSGATELVGRAAPHLKYLVLGQFCVS